MSRVVQGIILQREIDPDNTARLLVIHIQNPHFYQEIKTALFKDYPRGYFQRPYRNFMITAEIQPFGQKFSIIFHPTAPSSPDYISEILKANDLTWPRSGSLNPS